MKELLGSALQQEIEFNIELVLSIAPILKEPYRMASTKLQELKKQFKELLKNRFIRPSHFPWGSLTLFIKKI